MSDLDKLALQIEALRDLFNDNVNENDAYNQLSAEPRFGHVDPRVISSVYSDLRKKTIDDYSANLDKYWQSSMNVDCDETDHMYILSEHFAVISHDSIEDEQFHHFTVLDLFNNVTRRTTISKSRPRIYDLRPLNAQFLLLFEAEGRDYTISLIFFESFTGTFTKLSSYEKNFFCPFVRVDKTEPTMFFLFWINSEQHTFEGCFCNVKGKTIHFDEAFTVGTIIDKYPYSLEEDQLYFVKTVGGTRISKLDRVSNVETAVDLSPYPVNVCEPRQNYISYASIEDHGYWPVKFKEIEKFGVICASFQSSKWKVLPFAIDQQIDECEIGAVDSGLIVCSRKEIEPKIDGRNKLVYNVYKIPVRKPTLLRQLAWITLVRSMKKRGMTDPYEAASYYLPLNSDIRCHFKGQN